MSQSVEFDGGFYKNVLDNMYDGAYFVDRGGEITYWNKGAERLTGFVADEVIGERCSDNLLMHVDDAGYRLCEGGCPVNETLADGCPREADVYLHHKDGHRVPVRVRVAPIRDERGGIVGAVESFNDNSSKVSALERIAELEKIAYIDPLTEIANRRYTEITMRSRHQQMSRYGWPYGIVLIDIDHFKNVNDAYGHNVGDRVLRMVAKTLLGCSRSFDIVGRWGGEEFLAVISNVNDDSLRSAANRFRILVERSSMTVDSRPVGVTISAGATVARSDDTESLTVKRADELMFQSKEHGRNQVSLG